MDTLTTDDGNYHIKIFGNGWAYSVTCQRTGRNFFVQDDDAAQLQTYSNNFANTVTLGDYMDALGETL